DPTTAWIGPDGK
nr:soluble beta-fructofuranosidase isoenzyme I, S-beta F=invertase [Daucus carota L.=carrots, cv. Nantaise, Peptide Partial, 12 aa] [Daucus carota]